MPEQRITLVECPRDAMQGFEHLIPTTQKIRYLNGLLQVGFDVLDFGSFVSPTAVPQMADTAEVLDSLIESPTELLAIVAGKQGINQALQHKRIDALGFPFSISETFQIRNTRKSVSDAFELVKFLIDECNRFEKQLVVYLSMGFGNPYGDIWSQNLVIDWCGKLFETGVTTISLSDTVGQANAKTLGEISETCVQHFPNKNWGIHMHTSTLNWKPKVEAVWNAGIRRFDGAIQGFGGCPFAEDELVGNLPTEKLLSYCNEKGIVHGIKTAYFEAAYNLATETFAHH